MSDSQIIALCNAVEGSGNSLGAAVGLGTSTSQFRIEVAKVIHSIVIFSPARDAVSVDFLEQLGKIKDVSHLGKHSLYIPAYFF